MSLAGHWGDWNRGQRLLGSTRMLNQHPVSENRQSIPKALRFIIVLLIKKWYVAFGIILGYKTKRDQTIWVFWYYFWGFRSWTNLDFWDVVIYSVGSDLRQMMNNPAMMQQVPVSSEFVSSAKSSDAVIFDTERWGQGVLDVARRSRWCRIQTWWRRQSLVTMWSSNVFQTITRWQLPQSFLFAHITMWVSRFFSCCSSRSSNLAISESASFDAACHRLQPAIDEQIGAADDAESTGDVPIAADVPWMQGELGWVLQFLLRWIMLSYVELCWFMLVCDGTHWNITKPKTFHI